jgi:pimeloyl-ACP methyl ester carboxylesterase
MRIVRYCLPILPFVLFACVFAGGNASPPAQTNPNVPSVPGKCGDGVCEGPENPDLCPQDCPAAGSTGGEAGILSAGSEENTYWLVNPASGAKLFLWVSYPESGGESLLPALILIPGGLGTPDLQAAVETDVLRMTAAGFAVVQFDADGRGASGGEEDYNGFVHQDGLAALILAAAQIPRVDPFQLGVISRSYGVTMASGALGRHPDLPVRFYIDWEGPSDREYTTHDCPAESLGIAWPPCDDEAFWSEREAVNFIGAVRVPYQRIQTATDHAQGASTGHAVDMVNAAVQGGVPWVRLNNYPVNQIYDAAHPPAMFPDSYDKQLVELMIRYAGEMLEL